MRKGWRPISRRPFRATESTKERSWGYTIIFSVYRFLGVEFLGEQLPVFLERATGKMDETELARKRKPVRGVHGNQRQQVAVN